MAFEDLHWADATSLLLLEQLFADTEALPLLIVCTGRPERDHPSWRLKDETARDDAPPVPGDRAGGPVG